MQADLREGVHMCIIIEFVTKYVYTLSPIKYIYIYIHTNSQYYIYTEHDIYHIWMWRTKIKNIRMKNYLASVKHKFLGQIQSIYQTQNFKINIDDTPAVCRRIKNISWICLYRKISITAVDHSAQILHRA